MAFNPRLITQVNKDIKSVCMPQKCVYHKGVYATRVHARAQNVCTCMHIYVIATRKMELQHCCKFDCEQYTACVAILPAIYHLCPQFF